MRAFALLFLTACAVPAPVSDTQANKADASRRDLPTAAPAAETAPTGAAAEESAMVVLESVVASAHPYADDADQGFVVYAPEAATSLRLFLPRYDLEEGYDTLEITDDAGNVIETLTGRGGGWTAPIPGYVARLRLRSDESVRRFGFELTAFAYTQPALPADAVAMPIRLDVPVMSASPYANGTAEAWTLAVPSDAVGLRVHFDHLDLEEGWDWLHISDAVGRRVHSFTGGGAKASVWVEGREAALELLTDGSITAEGFRVSSVEAYVPARRGGDDLAGEGDSCAFDTDCAAGLICAGGPWEGDEPVGLCNPDWMRGTFTWSRGPVAIPDASEKGVTLPLEVDGLASVSTDVEVALTIRHAWKGDLRVTLTNPSGTESVLHDRVGGSGDDVVLAGRVMGFPGDESVNGEWTLRVQDLAGGDVGVVESYALTITSRWD